MSDPPRLVGLGEILWDLLPAGPVLGGAPANFAYQARRCGARAALVSALGADPLGDRARRELELQGIDHSAVAALTSHETGTVTVEIGKGGEPAYRIAEWSAWDCIPETSAAITLVRSADAVCFGTLASRRPVSRAAIHRLLDAVPPACLRIFDVNLRLPWVQPDAILHLLGRCDVVKMNESELNVLAELLGVEGDETGQIEHLARRFSLRLVALTKGSAGCRVFADGQHAVHPGFPVPRLVDTVGAGDAFTAALTLSMLRGLPLTMIAEESNRAASGVCLQSGAFPAGLAPVETNS